MSTNHEKHQFVQQSPTIEQLLEYRSLLIDVLHRQGRDIKYAVHYAKGIGRDNTEYLLPRTLTEWTEPIGEKKRIKIDRDRVYSASFRRMGEGAARLLVIEHENKLTEMPDFNLNTNEIRMAKFYQTDRRLYRFSYSPLIGMYEAEMSQSQIISSPGSDIKVVPADEFGFREIGIFDHENTIAENETKEHTRYDGEWVNVTAEDAINLLQRTRQYSADYDQAHPVYKAA